MDVIQRLHEQREFPNKKVINLNLQKGVLIENLLWNEKTEDVDIKQRLILKDFSWSTENGYDFLTMELEKVDLQENKKIVDELVGRILAKHFDAMKYSFMQNMIERTERMVDKGYLVMRDIKRIEKDDKTRIAKTTEKVYEE